MGESQQSAVSAVGWVVRMLGWVADGWGTSGARKIDKYMSPRALTLTRNPSLPLSLALSLDVGLELVGLKADIV